MAHVAAAPFPLLDLPDTALERILVAASCDGRLEYLAELSLTCKRLHGIACAAARVVKIKLTWRKDRLRKLAALPRLGALRRVELDLHDYDYMFRFEGDEEEEEEEEVGGNEEDDEDEDEGEEAPREPRALQKLRRVADTIARAICE
jgi:hypothetical protein